MVTAVALLLLTLSSHNLLTDLAKELFAPSKDAKCLAVYIF